MKRRTNRWVAVLLGLLTCVVVGRHLQRLGWIPWAEDAAAQAPALDPLGVRVAHAEPLPEVESGPIQPDPDPAGPDVQDGVAEGGALGVPGVAAEADPDVAAGPRDSATETPRPRVPLNPEPPLPEKDRPRSAPQPQGPLTAVDPHQMLFEPGEKPSKAARRSAPREAPTRGPVTDVDPRQMLFEPGERPPKGWVRKTPVETREPEAPAPDAAVPDDATTEPATEPSSDAQTKARIMKRLLRVMELAGEKP
jgi:hypothetical protein